MRRWLLHTAIWAATISPAFAADPVGEWTVADGVARIGIDICEGHLWGVVAWEKEPGGVDENNPDPARRNQPTLGMPVLLDMVPANGRWEGQVYNAKNGKTYSAQVSLVSADELKVQGCLMTNFLCGGETWTRYSKLDSAPGSVAPMPAPAPPRSAAPQHRREGGQGAPRPGAAMPAAAPKPVSAVCAAVLESAGPAHKSGLK